MRRLMRWAARLYPAAWRARYGAEFEALLEDMVPEWRDVWNVAAGALKMQMTAWTGWKTVAALGAAGAIAMAVAAFLVQPVYESSAVMRVTPAVISEGQGANPNVALAERLDYARTKVLDRSKLAGIIAGEKLYPGEKTVYDRVARMQRDVTIAPAQGLGGRPLAFAMRFRYPDAGKAQQVVWKLVALMMEDNITGAGVGQRSGGIAALLDARHLGSQVMVLDAPSLPQAPVFPNWRAMIAMGLAVGLLIGTMFCARTAWRLVLMCGAIGAPLAIGLATLLPGRPVSHGAAAPLAVLGFLLGLTIGSVAVMLRRRPLAG